MIIGVPKEIKEQEYRVGLTPNSVRVLVAKGHEVLLEENAGSAAGFNDLHYQEAGAKIVSSIQEVYSRAQMIVKVKELQGFESTLIKPGQIIFAFLHLAPDLKQTEFLLASHCVALAYETITDDQGSLPLLAPMSEVAGRLSVQVGAHYLEKAQGGKGKLLGCIVGAMPAKVVVLGGGVAGTEAIRVALAMGAQVVVFDKSLKRLRDLNNLFDNRIITLASHPETIALHLENTDLVIGSVLVPGATAPKLVTKQMLHNMKPGTVMIDLAIDQGGCFATSHATTHTNPTFVEQGITHYCVTNMPSSVPNTASEALNNATLPYIMAVAAQGYKAACLNDPHLLKGLNVCAGQITHPAVALSLQKAYVPAETALDNATRI